MSHFTFSFTQESTRFSWPAESLNIVVQKGYNALIAGMSSATALTEWHIEMMIYRAEEIIESDPQIIPVQGEAFTEDKEYKAVCDRYLAGAKEADSFAIEDAFNHLAEQLSYKPLSVTDEQLKVLACFIFIREITHHLGITRICQQ